ncbi:MAG: hypothetical protein BWK76_26385, partial [Desulfobulbaceae bacterium A2]
MNRILVSAALLAAFTAAVHIVAGGSDIAGPLLASTLAAEPRLTLYAVWHMGSVMLVFSAIALGIGSLPGCAQGTRALVLFISLLWCAFGLVFLAIIVIHLGSGSLFTLPQWVL